MSRRDKRELDCLRATLATISDVYARPSLATMQRSLTSKKPAYAFVFFLGRVLFEFFPSRIALIGVAIFMHRGTWLPSRRQKTFQLSLTENNSAILRRVNSLINPALGIDESINEKKISLWNRLCCVGSVSDLVRCARELEPYKNSTPLICIFLVLSAASYLLLHRAISPTKVRYIFLANDHSPIAVALLNVAKYHGIKTVYFQHGNVTEDFPPLAADLSVLHNIRSVKVYQLAAQKRSAIPVPSEAILILPPFSDRFRMPEIGMKPYHVCIYLSYFPKISALCGLVETISKLTWVRKISLRKHPRCKINLEGLISAGGGKCKIVDAVSFVMEKPDLGIVSNSGVVIEALHKGIPLVYFRDGDTIPDDYYGYVGEGIVPKYEEGLLRSPEAVNAFYDNDWCVNFSQYDPTLEKDISKVERDFIAGISSFLEN